MACGLQIGRNYLDHSEVLKVNTRDLEHRVLAPNERDVDIHRDASKR